MDDTHDVKPPFEHLELRDLFRIGETQDQLNWEPFHPGVEIHRLYGDGLTGPKAALIRFREAASIPMHEHRGYEHILVLEGQQQDENGVIRAGTLRIHPPGTVHRHVSAEAGCIVLAIYEETVRFV